MPKRNHTLTILFALFFIPFFLACGLYFSAYHLHTTNQGTLLNPVLQADFLDDKRQWKVIYLAPTPCDKHCHTDLKQLSGLWQTLGKNQTRVWPVVLHQSATIPSPLSHLHYQQLPQSLEQARHQKPNAFVFIADPLNNLMLAYDQPTWPQDLNRDLKKLLHISQIG